MYSCSALPDDNKARVRASSRDNNLVGVEMARDLGRLRFGVTGNNKLYELRVGGTTYTISNKCPM